MRVVVITGVSGSGKSVALNVLEDDGYFCVDNLPARFLLEVVMSLQDSDRDRVAVAVDVRSGLLADLRQAVAGMGRFGHDVRVLFLNARTDTLVRRYSESRRPHPLAGAGGAPTLTEAIERERELLTEVEELGVAIDTSDLHPNVLRQWVRSAADAERAAMTLVFESFAYKQGVPLDADLVFDARCLPNPYYHAELRTLTGLDAPVAEFLCEVPAVPRLIDSITDFLSEWLPSYIQENRSYLTVAIGCTGGQHRSVYVCGALARRFAADGQRVLVRHRGLESRAAQRAA